MRASGWHRKKKKATQLLPVLAEAKCYAIVCKAIVASEGLGKRNTQAAKRILTIL